MCVIKEDPRPVLRTLIKMLSKTQHGTQSFHHFLTHCLEEPGGFLQWGEMDHSTRRFERAGDDVSLQEITRAGEYPSTLVAQDSRLDQKYYLE